jgi:hypothetical protein
MAMTGYYKTFVRPRTHRPLSMMKYDPVGTFFCDLMSFRTEKSAAARLCLGECISMKSLLECVVVGRGSLVETGLVANNRKRGLI